MVNTTTTPNGPVTFANPKIFNNEENSDIVIEFNGQKIHAHRIILRMWSPFFERALTSKFAVAQSQTFSLGDDDNPEVIWAMLRHMYNFDYSFGKALNAENSPSYHIDVYEIADKYDCPNLRGKAVYNFTNSMKRLARQSHMGKIVPIITRVCGPATSHPAHSEVRNLLARFCFHQFELLVDNVVFVQALEAGNLFDPALTKDFLAYSLSKFADLKAGPSLGGTRRRTGARRSLNNTAIGLEGSENPFEDD